MALHLKVEGSELPEALASLSGNVEFVWKAVREEAEAIAKEECMDLESEMAGLLPSLVHNSILKWDTLGEALAAHLAAKLASPFAELERWRIMLTKLFSERENLQGETLVSLMCSDLQVIKERDPACLGLAHALLFSKGFHGLQLYRASNILWLRNQKSLASLLQSVSSETFGMDLHPGARLGRGIMIDHATGVVIGETAVVGPGCTLLHGVTLGGTGKDTGDRHPKLGSNVLVGAGASILGNVKIGSGAKIGAAALVLTDIPAHATAVGAPAKVVGRASEDNPATKMDTACRSVVTYPKRGHFFCPFRHLDTLKQDCIAPCTFCTRIITSDLEDPETNHVMDLFIRK